MKAIPLIAMGISAIGLVACQGSQPSKAPTPTESTAPVQPAGNEVRDVKQPAPSPMASMESSTETPAAKQMVEQMQQSQSKMAEAPTSTKTTGMSETSQASGTAALPMGDAARGGKLAGKCKACHNFNDKKKVGPGLAGVVGRKVGSMAGMSYSASLKNGNWVWDAAHLAPWLCDTAAAVKEFTDDANAKTKMPAMHICDPQQQADLIAYLKTL